MQNVILVILKQLPCPKGYPLIRHLLMSTYLTDYSVRLTTNTLKPKKTITINTKQKSLESNSIYLSLIPPNSQKLTIDLNNFFNQFK